MKKLTVKKWVGIFQIEFRGLIVVLERLFHHSSIGAVVDIFIISRRGKKRKREDTS